MQTENSTLSDLLLAEVLPAWTRQSVTLTAQTAALPLGAVLSSGTNGAYAPVAFGTGAAAASAVLLEAAPAGATQAVVAARGAVVNAAALVWPSGATDDNKAAGLAALTALGIVPRAVL
jgi:hypothetical protein